MGVKDDFSAASMLGKVVLALLLLANFLNWIAFCTTEWGRSYTVLNSKEFFSGYGIWRICRNSEGAPGCVRTDGWALNWYGAFQAFAIFGFLGINVACLLVILTTFVSKCKKNKEAGLAAAILCFIAAVSYLIAVIIFGARFDNTYMASNVEQEPSYSFALAVISLILAGVTGILIIVDGRGGSGTSPA